MTNHHQPIRILIGDDHAVVRRGLRMVLSLRPDLEIVGEAGTENEAIQIALDKQPTLILLDLILPDTDGAKLAPKLLAHCPAGKILVLSGVQTAHLVRQAINAGIHGYALKEITPDELVKAIHQVVQGQSYMHPKITAIISQQIQSESHLIPPDTIAHMPALTKREQEVLTYIATSATNREIAERLTVSEETVRTHVKGVLRKLNQTNRTQAVVEALRLGLIEL